MDALISKRERERREREREIYIYICVCVCDPPNPAVAGERVREATFLPFSSNSKIGSSESNVWHSGLPAAGPIRPSLPWCFSAAAPSLDPSCARRKPPARRSKQFESWQCRTAGKGMVCS